MMTITNGAFSWQYDSTYVTLAPRHAGVPALTPERLELLALVCARVVKMPLLCALRAALPAVGQNSQR